MLGQNAVGKQDQKLLQRFDASDIDGPVERGFFLDRYLRQRLLVEYRQCSAGDGKSAESREEELLVPFLRSHFTISLLLFKLV